MPASCKPRFGYRQHVINICFKKAGMYSALDILSTSCGWRYSQSSVSSVLDDDDASATVCDGNTSSVRGVPAPGGVNPG